MDKKLQKRIVRVAKALEIIEKRAKEESKLYKIKQYILSNQRLLEKAVNRLESALMGDDKFIVPAIQAIVNISKNLDKVKAIPKQASAEIKSFSSDLDYAKALVRVGMAELKYRKGNK